MNDVQRVSHGAAAGAEYFDSLMAKKQAADAKLRRKASKRLNRMESKSRMKSALSRKSCCYKLCCLVMAQFVTAVVCCQTINSVHPGTRARHALQRH